MKKTFKKYFFMILKLAVAVLLLLHVGKGLDYAALKKLSPPALFTGFFLSTALILFQTTLSAIRWKMLLSGQNIHISLFKAISLTFQGAMFSLFLPGGAVGGDVLKGAFLAREKSCSDKVAGITTIFLDRLIGMLGLFSLAAGIALCSIGMIRQFPAPVRYSIYLLTLCCFAGVLAGIVIFFHSVILRIRLFALILEKADSLVKGAFSRILHSVEICRKDRATLWKTFFLTLLILHPLLIGCNLLTLYGLAYEEKGSAFQAAALASVMGNVASVAPVSPGGLGTRDKVTEVTLRYCGLSPEVCSLIPLLYTCAYVTAALLGGMFFFLWETFGKLRTSRREEEEE